MQVQGGYVEAGSSFYNSSAAESTKQIKAAPGKLRSLIVTNYNAAVRYLWVFDTDNGTTTGAPICPPIPLLAAGAVGSYFVLELDYAIPFTTGLFVASSTTGATYTAAGGTDLRISAHYK
jgi:hypothetical protein